MFSFAKKLVDRFEGHATQNQALDIYFKNATKMNNRGYALRVLNVVPHSLAHAKGFESWFDYIIKINNHELPMLYALSTYSYTINEDGSITYGNGVTTEQAAAINVDVLKQELSTLAQHKQEVVFDVWNAKGGVIRQISIPLKFESGNDNDNDNGNGNDNGNDKNNGNDNDNTKNNIDDKDNHVGNVLESFGLTVESQHLSTATYVWRILNTHPGSPAFRSQLVPHSDFIIGCDSAFPNDGAKGLLRHGGEHLLSNTVSSYYNHHYSHSGEDNVPITLYVYNHDYDILRPVTVNLSRSWGNGHNRGILGCDVGYGLIHRIPEVIGKFEGNAIVDDVLFLADTKTEHGFSSEALQQQQENSDLYITPALHPQPLGINSVSAVAPATTGVIPPPPKSTRKKKHVAALGDDGLSDYMNEELEKSKKLEANTRSKSPTTAGEVPPPPPPPAAAAAAKSS